MRADFAEAVYEVAELIPAGLVLSYGDIAELLEMAGPRQVGAAMSRSGDGAPWWRVIRASGQPPRGLSARALTFYKAEGTPLRTKETDEEGVAGGYTIDMRAARWHPTARERTILDGIRDRLAKMSVARDELLP